MKFYPLAKLISNRRAPIAKKIYQELGGSSPILKLTEEQSKALELKLNNDDQASEYKCFIVMRCWNPRANDVIKDITAHPGPSLVVTSGGLISMVMRQHLDLDIAKMANLALAIMNSSIHRLHPIGGAMSPVMFNSIPHLEAPERHHAQTHV